MDPPVPFVRIVSICESSVPVGGLGDYRESTWWESRAARSAGPGPRQRLVGQGRSRRQVSSGQRRSRGSPYRRHRDVAAVGRSVPGGSRGGHRSPAGRERFPPGPLRPLRNPHPPQISSTRSGHLHLPPEGPARGCGPSKLAKQHERTSVRSHDSSQLPTMRRAGGWPTSSALCSRRGPSSTPGFHR